MEHLVEDKEKKVVFRMSCKLNLSPILKEMGNGNEHEKDPNAALAEIGPGKRN